MRNTGMTKLIGFQLTASYLNLFTTSKSVFLISCAQSLCLYTITPFVCMYAFIPIKNDIF